MRTKIASRLSTAVLIAAGIPLALLLPTATAADASTVGTVALSQSQGAPALATGWHVFRDNASGNCLDQDYNGGVPHADILAYPCNHGPNELWDVILNSDGSYSFKNDASGRCLNQDYNGGVPHADVIAYPCGTNANQNWWQVKVGPRTAIYLMNEASIACLDQDYNSGVEHLDVLAWSPCNFGNNEGWTEVN
jgi:Ricin-type beta-trefoil lectin domain